MSDKQYYVELYSNPWPMDFNYIYYKSFQLVLQVTQYDSDGYRYCPPLYQLSYCR